MKKIKVLEDERLEQIRRLEQEEAEEDQTEAESNDTKIATSKSFSPSMREGGLSFSGSKKKLGLRENEGACEEEGNS